jgi:hypothetical protein
LCRFDSLCTDEELKSEAMPSRGLDAPWHKATVPGSGELATLRDLPRKPVGNIDFFKE